MKIKSKFFLWLMYPAFLCCLLPVAFFTFKHPAHNFDMLGYMALIVRMDQTHDINEIHTVTYSTAKELIPAEQYEKLTTTPAFRKEFATDPNRFEKLLPVYIVKPMYVWSAWVFYKAGFSLPAATVIPSIIAFLMIGVFLFYWLCKYLQTGIAFLAGLLIMFSIFTLAVAGLSTPDCLSAFFLFVAMYFILEKQHIAWMFIFFLLAVFTRVDNIITCFFMLTFLTFSPTWKRISKAKYLLMLTALAAAYVCIMLPVTQFGWNIFYYSRYARHIDFSRDFDHAVGFTSWLSFVYSKLVTALVSTHFTFFLFLALLVMASPAFSFRKLSFDQSFLLVLISVIFFRFLLLPDLSDRFYFGFYLVIILLLMRKFSSLILKQHYEDR